ncbi:3-hexulose-6-phosphate isomerase [Rhynchospora pubera]|uniref:3-hexulose-6-phosphate isomerase n=1 Tax=Rhynchospora pubera TaxID=906938 RepID=A0AAV8BV03_9POAL|nr:3-hexulose-6-phosphate isomerase [Rhynchospora pubera]
MSNPIPTPASTDAATMAAQICHQIQSIFSLQLPNNLSPPLDVLTTELATLRGRVFVYGVGREGLMMKAFCMRLFHLGLSAHVVGDMTTPPATAGDLLLASAGPGDFSTVSALCRVAKNAGARVVLITAKPDAESEARRCADSVVFVPAQTMADREEDRIAGEVRLPMGSLYEGALFVLFEMVVIKLAEVIGQSPAEMRARHTNLE